MSDELKIELQVETDSSKAKSQLDNLINEFNNKKPIDLKVNIGDTNLDTFKRSIKSITTDLQALSSINFNNLNSVATNLQSISKFVKEFNNLNLGSNNNTSNGKNNSIANAVHEFDGDIGFERLSKNYAEALAQIKALQNNADFLKEGFEEYNRSVKEAFQTFNTKNAGVLNEIKELEGAFDSKVWKKLIEYKQELNDVIREYNSLDVKLEEDSSIFESYNGDTWSRQNEKYVAQVEMSMTRFEEQVKRAKELNARKNQLSKNIENNLYNNKNKATEDEEAVFKLLSKKYDEITNKYKDYKYVEMSKANLIKGYLIDTLNDSFKLDFSNLDLNFDDDLRKAYDKFFDILKEVQEEYNNKFKDVEGFKELDILNTESLKQEVEKTAELVNNLKGVAKGTLEKLGFDTNALSVFDSLKVSIDDLENKLDGLKAKFGSAFEVSSESIASLDKIKDALVEINKLSDEQKQTFFDFGLDVDKIEKAKKETKELNETLENAPANSYDGLIESYSRLESASGVVLREMEKIKLSAMSNVTLTYGYEEADNGELEKTLKTAQFSENISKRTKQILKEYTSASNDLIKAQRAYYEAVNGGKASENTINKLSDNVKEMETNLSRVRSSIADLQGYPDVMDALFEDFNKLDEARHKQTDLDALKIIDKAELEQANKLLKESKTLIDSIAKDNVQLQKDLNAGYDETSKQLEDRIKMQEKQLTGNISKLMNISNSKAAIDQIFSYQLEKANKTQIEIARLQDKANKNTGTKTVDEQDEYLKQYKRYLTELKSIQKSLTKESNEQARTDKIFQLDNTFKKLDEIKSKLKEVKAEAAQEFYDKAMRELDLNLSNSFSKTVSELDKVEEKISKLSKSDYVDKSAINAAETIIGGLRNTLNKGLDNLDSKSLSGILVQIEKLKHSAKDIDLNIKIAKDSERIETFIKGVTDRLEVLQSTANGIDISHITSQFRELTAGSDRNSVVMKSINDDVKNLEQSLRRAGNVASTTGLGFRRFFDDLGDSLRTFTLGEVIGDVITDSLYQTWDVIKEMDAAMANIKKVADETDVNSIDKLDSIRSQAIDVAKEVGMASSDVMNAIADTLQAGVGGMTESIEVARSAMILANVGDMSQSDASKSLNTIINGFKLEPLKEIDVQVGNLTQKTTELANAMDLLNFAGNNYAIGADGVAEAMRRGGTVLSQYGVALEDSVAMVTAANEAIQDPARIGNGLKSLSINMAGVKAAAKDGSVELNKTAKALSEIAGIDVYSDKAKGEIKGMVEILDELHEKVKANKLTEDEFLALSEAMAGKEQSAVLQSLIGNYETFKQIREEFAQGLHFGSAEKENAAYVDSLAGKLNKLKEIWIDTLMVLADSDSVRGLFDAFIKVSEGINSFIKGLDSIHATFPVLLGLISGGSSAFKTLWNAFDEAESSTNGLTGGLTNTASILKGGLVPAIKNFVKQGLLIGGITAAVQFSAFAWDKLTNSVKKAGEELDVIEEEQKATISSQNAKIKALETTGVKYEELANKAKRTTEEEEEMIRLGNELAEILPEMVIGYDEENNAILHMTDDMQTLIDKAKEANDQYNRLLLGTQMEKTDNGLKMLTKGEIFGEDKDGYIQQKIDIQEDYNARMGDLQNEYIALLNQAAISEGKTKENLLKGARDVRNKMITEESKYQTEYAKIQSKILAVGEDFRGELDTTWRQSVSLLVDEITPELEKGISAFTNSIDLTEISSEEEVEAIRRIFREIPELAQSGAVDIEKLNTQIADINKEFARTGNIEDYNLNMKELSKSVSESTGWDANVLYEMFAKINDGTLKSATGLDAFLEAFGRTRQELNDGDSVAKALHKQFNEINDFLDALELHDFGDVDANLELRMNLQNNEDIPKQIKDMVNTLVDAGVEDRYILPIAGQVMMSLQDGKIDENELYSIEQQLVRELTEKLGDEKKVDLAVKGILDSFNSEEMIKAIEDELGDKSVEKEVTITADNPEKIEQIDKAIELLASRPDVDKAVRAVVEGEDDLVFFAEIIKNLPVNKDFTNKFIIENADALSKLNNYKEVVDYINGLPPEVRKTYGIKAEGLDTTTEQIEKIDDTINTVNQKELKVTSSNDDVLQTIEDVEALIKISSEVEKGKYKIEIDATTQQAIDNINALKDSVNNLNKELGSGKSISYHASTEQAAKNISGLKNRVNEIKKLTGKTFKYHATTAQAAKNISGLIKRVDELNKKKGKTFTWNANTAQAAKNISGLINRIDQINGKKSKSFSYSVSTSVAAESSLADFANQVQADTLAIQEAARTGEEGVNQAVSSYTGSLSKVRTSPAIRALSKNQVMPMIEFDVDALSDFENALKRIQNELDLLSSKAEFAFGDEKIAYLKEQISLLEKQQKIQNQMSKDLSTQQNELKYFLGQKGFKFNSKGDVINQAQKLLEMEKYVATLEDRVNAQEKNNDESSKKKNEASKKKNEALQKQYDNARESLDKTKKALNQYLENNSKGVVGATKEWYELQKQINETRAEIIQATIDAKNFKFEIGANKFEAEVQELTNAIELLDKQIEYAFGEEKEKLIKKKIELLKKEQVQVHNLANQYREQAKNIGDFLNTKGFIIESDGSIGNMELLEKFKDSGIYEEILEQVEKYNELTLSKIPEAQQKWWDLRKAIDEARIATLEAKDELSDLVLEVNISKLDGALKKIRAEVSRIEREISKAFGGKKESLLSQKIEALKQEQDKLHQMANEYRKQRQEIANFLNSKGFIIHPDGSIGNPEFILNFKKDPALMQYLQGLIDKHNQLGDKIADLGNDWQGVQGSIEDTKDAIEEARRELEKFINQAKIDALLDQFNDLAHQLDLIDKKLEHATGMKKLNLLSQKLELIKQQQIELQKHWEFFNNKKGELQGYLGGLGFTFDADGDITNYVSQLEQIANSSDNFEEVKEKLEEYFDIQNDRLPSIESDWLDLENTYKDVLKDQLNTTKEIEDKITEMYKKQVQDRIDAMNKETDAKLKALKKQQEAYNKYREETDYKNEYEDKLTEINDIQRQLDIAMRDTSLAGQKKVQQLQKLLADAQKELDKFTQNKIDSDINDMFDKESERLEEENESAIEELEKEWSDAKIAEMVAQALGSGVFTDIEGNVHDLEDALINFADETGELFGVLGTVIKSELITNLEIAKDTVKNLANIMKELDLSAYVSAQNSRSIMLSASSIPNLDSYSPNVSNQVSITAPIVNIEGSVDSNVVEQLKDISNKITKDVIDTIAKSIR